MSSLGVSFFCVPCPLSSTDPCLGLTLADDKTDMKVLEEAVRSIEQDGLVWGLSKLVPVGFGIKKLQINLVIEDEKVSLDDLQDTIADFEEYIQSSDIVAMQKL